MPRLILLCQIHFKKSQHALAKDQINTNTVSLETFLLFKIMLVCGLFVFSFCLFFFPESCLFYSL